tara:strand:+ start:471 stop:806 length:336 start_codon:yes stop_codon:yes gene_type:complete
MTTTNEIDWSVLNTGSEKEQVALKEVPLDTEVSIKFDRVFNTPSGNIGAEVTTEVSGELIWLSGSYGAQNGMMSLIKAAGGNPDDIEGNTFNFTRITSEKSPVGYAYRWTA